MAVNPRMSNKYPETSEGEPSREPGRGDATPSHEVGAAPTRRRLSVVEIRQASDEISKLLGYSDGIKRAKREMFAKYGLSPKRTTRLIKAILASWHAEARRVARIRRSSRPAASRVTSGTLVQPGTGARSQGSKRSLRRSWELRHLWRSRWRLRCWAL